MILEIACPIPVRKTFDYKLPDSLSHLTPDDLLGRRVKISFGFKKIAGLVIALNETSSAPLDKLKSIEEVLDPEPILNQEMIDLGRWMSHRYLCSLGEAMFSLLPPGKTKAKSFQDSAQEMPAADPHFMSREEAPVFTVDQSGAIQKVHEAIFNTSSKIFCLFGVAAAGKTEVYMAAIKDAMTQGKTALFLTPEIGLAIQTAQVLKDRFGEKNVLFWHSDLPLKKRIEDWWRIKRGEFSVVIGPRSAVLVPLPHLGVLIVDEEHDSAFKEDRKPRFHVRDVALERAKQKGAVAILGSATPSFDLWYKTKTGEVELLELSTRALSSSAPHVKIVDMKEQKYKGLISRPLEQALQECLKNKEQAILFLNKRGFHRYLRCSQCGWIFRCPKCAITLVEHKGHGTQCHYCGEIFPPPPACPDCGKKELKGGGYGTERVVEELKEKFPWAHVLRWDRDSAAQKGKNEILYKEFLEGKYDILVGTQVVAQGFNFPNVTLVGILDADVALHLPDFRASEKTFQLITQVAGRAGRALITGEVLIQTHHPQHDALQFSLQMDFKSFAERELQFRQDLNYPPFTHLVRIQATNAKLEEAEKNLGGVANWVREIFEPIGLIGPLSSKRKKKGAALSQLILKIPSALFDSFISEFEKFLESNPKKITVDVDPETLI